MKNKMGTSDSELIDRNLNHQNFGEESYSENDSKEHSAEITKQRIISDGEKWIETQKLKLKLEGIEDYYGFTVKSVRKEIEGYSQNLESNENMKQDIVNNINKANDRLDYPGIYQAAALLLIDLKKGSPYFSFPGKDNSGLWVKALLGKKHFEQFVKEKENCIKELETVNSKWEKRPLEDMLASCELDYIFHNVLGANSHLKYFGSCEGSNNQDGITNPSNLILSETFANELRGLYQSGLARHSAKIN